MAVLHSEFGSWGFEVALVGRLFPASRCFTFNILRFHPRSTRKTPKGHKQQHAHSTFLSLQWRRSATLEQFFPIAEAVDRVSKRLARLDVTCLDASMSSLNSSGSLKKKTHVDV